MKYQEPKYEVIILETEDIMGTSGTMSEGNITIKGEEETFFENFENLLG